MKTITGDLIELAEDGAFDVIVHGANCMCTMGAGIALAIRKNFPEAYEADLTTEKGDKSKLGTCTEATALDGRLIVVNAYTQYDYRGPGTRLDYNALAACLREILRRHSGRRIGLPKIGAGLAGGDWRRISEIIGQELAGEDVTIVEFR